MKFSTFFVHVVLHKMSVSKKISCYVYEPHHEKTCLLGFRPGETQTGLLS